MHARLTPVSYIVLGLVREAGEATPYDLKRMVADGVGHMWSVQHAQLYSEPERLAAGGLLSERREEGGRRRRRYRLTAAGRVALDAWLGEPARETGELRDPGLLKVFLGADPARVAPGRLEHHRRTLVEYEAHLAAAGPGPVSGPLLTLQAGIAHERVWIEFWSSLAPGC